MNYSSSYNYSRGDSPSTSRRMLAESKEAALRANNTCVQSFRKILHSKDPIGCLVSCTKFSGREIKLIYRNFKQDCPDGLVSAEILRDIYTRFFPCGSPGQYAYHVFRTMDRTKSGKITFKEFLIWLSEVSHGDTPDKLRWTFKLYDVNEDGLISKSDLIPIIKSIYLLMGKKRESEDDELLRSKTESFFNRFNKTSEGVINYQEFCSVCTSDPIISKSLEQFATII